MAHQTSKTLEKQSTPHSIGRLMDANLFVFMFSLFLCNLHFTGGDGGGVLSPKLRWGSASRHHHSRTLPALLSSPLKRLSAGVVARR
jgi:hypothetical protein